VGGGIPVIRTISGSLTADEIFEISGILNGTTNFMLTKMKNEGMSYDEAVKLAQELGYAERNPAADVEGYDSCRKIAILTSLVCGSRVDFEEVHTQGITEITGEDFSYAKAMNADIKLLGVSRSDGEKTFVFVRPAVVFQEDPLYMVSDVFNAIKIKGNMLGDVMLYGAGAGKLPTASAVVSDVVQAVLCRGENVSPEWSEEKYEIDNISELQGRFLVRIKGGSESEGVKRLLKDGEQINAIDGETGIVTGLITESELDEICRQTEGFISKIFVLS